MGGGHATYSECWLAMLESGEVQSLKKIAEREKIDNGYRPSDTAISC